MMILCFFAYNVFGEVIFDGSMNASTTNLKLEGKMDIKSDYGKISGKNLFHSFSTFNVNVSEQVTFSSEQAVQNIIARVTGGQFSTINGPVISTIDNLYLINPQGILFGKNASIDIDGSFYATTADYIASNDEHFYSMIEKEAILFSEKPSAFGFLSDDSHKMIISGNWNSDHDTATLSVKPGNTISLIANGLEINDAKLYAEQGNINLASVSSKGTIDLNALDQSDNCLKGDIQINHSQIDVSGDGSGDIFIRGGRIVIKKESDLMADNTGSAQAGQTNIQATSLTIDFSNIYSDSLSTGDGGQIQIQTDNTLMLTNQTRVYADASNRQSGAGNGGTITLKSKHIQLLNKSIVSSDTYGDGQGGKVNMTASETIYIQDECKIFTVAEGTGVNAGNGGIIDIQSPIISAIQNSIISTDSKNGYGNGGKIVLSGIEGHPAESITIYNSRIYSGAVDNGFGDGGQVRIIGKTISFINGAIIGSESIGRGKGGDVTITSSELNFWGCDLQNNASAIYTNALYKSEDAGDAGNITIYSDIVRLQNQSGLIANTEGPGQAGRIRVTARSLELIEDSSISSASLGDHGAGNGGKIQLDVFSHLNLNHAGILTSSFGDGHAGHISISAKSIYLYNQAGIRSESKATIDGGTAGKITIMADDILDINDSFISTEAINTATDLVNINQDKDNGRLVIATKELLKMIDGTITSSVLGGMGNGGDIDIDPELVLMNHSKIIANAYKGNGGNIHMVADHFIQSSDSVVRASSQYGLDGQIFIDAPDAKISNELLILPSNYLDASQWLRTPCSIRTSKDVSRLVITGRDAIPSNVDDLYMSPALTFLPDDGSDPLRSGKIDAEFFNGLYR